MRRWVGWRYLLAVYTVVNVNLSSAQDSKTNVDSLFVLRENFSKYHSELFRKCGSPDKLPVLTDYTSDAKRTADEALKSGQGGMCGVHALVAAKILRDHGVPESDMRIISTVQGNQLDYLCKDRGGKEWDRQKPRSHLSGHQFLLIKTKTVPVETWQLINTTTVPGTRVKKPDGQIETVKELEAITFISPEEIEKKLKSGPIKIPSDVVNSIPPEHLTDGFYIHHQVEPLKYPHHSEQYPTQGNLIASGDPSNSVCRWDGVPKDAEDPGKPSINTIEESVPPRGAGHTGANKAH